MSSSLILATRKSPLALAQAQLASAHLEQRIPDCRCELLKIVTTGDKRTEWSLEKQGGKGLFTSELEAALMRGEADLAIHSSKDLPTEMADGLALAGFLPREVPNDVLVVRDGVETPRTIATGSPRRRQQLERIYPDAEFSEIRGNVDTRLRKISEGVADATVLAAAGLRRLGIHEHPGVRFEPLTVDVSVPAVGQAAVALQCRAEDVSKFAPYLHAPTARAVFLERAFLERMGGGCHVAFAAHYAEAQVHLFHESFGYRVVPVSDDEAAQPEETATRILNELKAHD